MAKTFKCPYCDYHGSRQDLVEHIDDEHDEMIPEGFSPVHLVFDIVNGKKDHHGVCVVCKRDTEWDENASKYKRLCGRKQCAEALRDIYKKNMLKVHGKITLLNDPEQQKKMLANRGISGKVQFDDKGFHTYTGSYERKLLEFENSIGFKSSDILSPGPTIEYDYKGEKHEYITDQMIIPFNLIIEVKDGGGNTNNRINDDSRDRTIAKEIAITKLGKYNYLRLTNNSFDQLLETLAELKAQMVDDSEDNKKVIININEEVEALKEMLTGEEPVDMRQFEFVASPSTDGGERAMNSVVMVNGKQYRARVETLIIKNGKIYAQKQDKINKYGYAYKIPGGSIEPDITLNASAQKECNEEARIIVKDLKYSGISYVKSFNGEYPEWHKKKLWPIGLKYEGSLAYIFVGYYGQQYKDKVDKIDYDDLYKHAKFYTADELDISPEHEKALKKYGIHRTRFDD